MSKELVRVELALGIERPLEQRVHVNITIHQWRVINGNCRNLLLALVLMVMLVLLLMLLMRLRWSAASTKNSRPTTTATATATTVVGLPFTVQHLTRIQLIVQHVRLQQLVGALRLARL